MVAATFSVVWLPSSPSRSSTASASYVDIHPPRISMLDLEPKERSND
jgi:hypothetical protein